MNGNDFNGIQMCIKNAPFLLDLRLKKTEDLHNTVKCPYQIKTTRHYCFCSVKMLGLG